MYVERHTINLTTDASGDATGYTPVVTGRVISVQYVADGSTPFDNTADFTITGEDSGQTIWAESNLTTSKTVAPRQATHSTAGVASLYAAAGTAVQDHVYLASERIKLVVAQGGNVKIGQFRVTIG